MKYVKCKSKRGSSAVFLTLILAALMSITLALIYGVKSEAIKSSADAIINLAGDSVLSEFDRRLQEEYGLFLIKGPDGELSSKLHKYISYSFDDMDDVKIESISVSSGKYSLADAAIVRGQIVEHMKIMDTEGKVEKMLSETADEDIEYGKDGADDRTLRHGPTMVSLPSASVHDKGLTAAAEDIADRAKEVDKAFEKGTENYLINRYIFSYFNSKRNMVDKSHFFRKEVEYILGGEMSDSKNEKRVEIALKAMRFPINLAYLYSDPEKQAALAAAAQAMTPGAAAAATQAALASTWAYAESDNDVELLWEGKRVPIVKDDSTWAVELDNAIEGIGGTVEPKTEKGFDYNGYLQILLFFQDENIKISRILDLIQINMRAKYDEKFLIGEYSTGITVKVKINGKTYQYDKIY